MHINITYISLFLIHRIRQNTPCTPRSQSFVKSVWGKMSWILKNHKPSWSKEFHEMAYKLKELRALREEGFLPPRKTTNLAQWESTSPFNLLPAIVVKCRTPQHKYGQKSTLTDGLIVWLLDKREVVRSKIWPWTFPCQETPTVDVGVCNANAVLMVGRGLNSIAHLESPNRVCG